MKIRIILTLICCSLQFGIYPQNNDSLSQFIGSKDFLQSLRNRKNIEEYEDVSRIGIYKNSIGSYKQILHVDKTVISAGDKIKIDYLISGYGKIEAAKLNFSPSTDILCKVIYTDNLYIKNGTEEPNFSTKQYDFRPIGTTIMFESMISYDELKVYESIFSSVVPKSSRRDEVLRELNKGKLNVTSINTEIYNDDKSPPYNFELFTKKDIPPGDYNINFTLTYYNGTNFETDFESVRIRIMSWHERNESMVKLLGLLLAILSFLGILDSGFNLYDKREIVFKRIKSFKKEVRKTFTKRKKS